MDNDRSVEQFRSSIAQNLLYLDGRPFSLAHYPFLYAVYDGNFRKTLFKTGRQIGKSITLANFIIADSIGQPHFKTIYISPTAEQTRKFSHTRVGKIMAYSPMVRKRFIGPASIDNVLLRILKNGSELAFSFAMEEGDRIRGYSADRVCIDEIQDISADVIPVVEECMANSKYAYSLYAGTPKTSENTIEYLWGISSQTEWCMKCTGCNKRSFIDSPKPLGKEGPICVGCGTLLNVRNGKWVDMKKDAPIQGFHVPQLILPENVPAAWTGATEKAAALERWERLLYKVENYGESRFANEVLGISTGSGVRLISKEELEAMCDENHEMTRLPTPTSLVGVNRTFAGIDWSGGGGIVKGSEGLVRSRTVIWIWGDMPDGRLKTLYYKIFPPGHAIDTLHEIFEIIDAWGCQMIMGDAGEGALPNSMLREKYQQHRALQCRYMAMGKPIEWQPGSLAYHVDRTTMIDNFAMFIKNKGIILPKLAQATPAINDILAEFEEVTQSGSGRKVWKHSPSCPDDALHAALFGWLAAKIVRQDMRFYA